MLLVFIKWGLSRQLQSELLDYQLKARLHVKREGTARLETSTGSRQNLLFTGTNSVMCLIEKGMVLESPLERVLDCLHVVFFETGNDRAHDNLKNALIRYSYALTHTVDCAYL